MPYILAVPEFLYLSRTSFSGPLPRFTEGLIELDVADTLFDGGLEFSNFDGLNSLQWLVLDGCLFDAPIPQRLGELPNLEYLYAKDAMITGDLSYMEGMTSLFEHWIDNNPGLGGGLPTFLSDLPTLGSFSASNCNLSGPIPDEFGDLVSIQKMWLYGNNLSGDIPASLGNLMFLSTFEIEANQIVGAMPAEICRNVEIGFLTTLGADCGNGNKVVVSTRALLFVLSLLLQVLTNRFV